jgi:hypothetical protein
LQKSCNHDVAANFSLRVFFVFSALQTQAKACGYQNRTFARASEDKLIRIVIDTEPSDDIDEYFKQYKELLKERFKQIDIWITRHEIDVI